jgi:RNA polymerase sigma-70 factor (ECF subfamily)
MAESLSFEGVNDAAFLARLRAGDSAARLAFSSLVRATHGRLLGYVRRHLGDLEESQEVLQEVFLAAHKGLDGFEGKSKLTTWLFSLAHFKVCDRIADRTRDRAVFRDVGDGSDAGEESASARRAEDSDSDLSRVTVWDSAPDKVLARNRAERWIAAAVAALEPPGCDVYQLRDVEGLSGEEVAAMLGLSHAAVRVQLHRARATIVAFVRARIRGDGMIGIPGGKGARA